MTEMARNLERRLGLDSAVAVIVGEVIGVGIFLTPAAMAQGLGSPAWILAVWLAVGAVTACGALAYGELASRFPQAGGGYVYLREAWGGGVAFLYGWKSMLVLDPGLSAAFAAGLARYASFVVPMSPAGEKAVAIAAVLVVATVNVVGARVGPGLLRGIVALKLGLLAVIVVWGFLSGRGDAAHFAPFAERRAGSPELLPGLAAGLVAAFFCFAGFWDVAKLGAEVRDPARTLPRALAIGIALVTLVYLLVSAVFVYLVPIEASSSADAFAALVGRSLFGEAGGRLFAAVVAVAVLGSLAALLLAAPRVYLAMARDGLFFRSVGQLHPRLGTPVRATAIQASLACALLLLGTFDEIVAYFIFVAFAFVALTVAGLFRLPRPAAGAFRAPGHPFTTIAFLALLATLLVLLAAGNPWQSAAGVLVVLVGTPVYLLVRRSGRV
jgi:basic amino acid/polyamine antiporter, APA family